MPAIDVSGLVIRYGDVTAVDGLDMQADFGEVVALLGRNGAGKTSTVEALEGYRSPSAGHLRVLNMDPRRPDDHRKLTARVGVMLQSGGVYPAMNPQEAVRLFASYYDTTEDPEALLERLDLTGTVAKTSWRRLSGGEQQRLSLALALIGRPQVVFLDEPTSGVDPQGRIAIREVIGDLRARGTAVVVTTHELVEAERVADRVVIIDHGRVMASGRIDDLTRRGRRIRFTATPGLDVGKLSAHLGAAVTENRPGTYRVDPPSERPPSAVIAALTSWLADHEVPIQDLRSGDETLEELFLRVTGSEP